MKSPAFIRQVASLKRDVASGKATATSRYAEGYAASGADERALKRSLHLTFEDGARSVFAGFDDPWLNDQFYVVEIKKGPYGHRIASRFDLPPCQVSHVSNGSMYTYPNQHPC